jgi:hypothetical protein
MARPSTYDATGELIAEYEANAPNVQNGLRYLSPDHVGSTRLVTKQDRTVDVRYDYYPFGEELVATVSQRNTVSGYSASALAGKIRVPHSTCRTMTSCEAICGTGPGLPAYGTMLRNHGAKVHFSIMNGDRLHEDKREFTAHQWRAQVGLRNRPLPRGSLVGLPATLHHAREHKRRSRCAATSAIWDKEFADEAREP